MRRAVLLLTALLASGSFTRAQTGETPSEGAPSVTLRRLPSTSQACGLPAGPLPTATRAVFILDTSGSMRGLGDGRANIFGRVKTAVNAYVRARNPDRVDLVTFDSGPRFSRSYALPGDRGRWNTDLAALRANGQNTYLYRSVARALAPLSRDRRYATTVFILTDGIDNDPDPAYTARRALAAFRAPGPLDALYYVALGTEIPADARAALRENAATQGLTVPAGQVPTLGAFGNSLASVTDPERVSVPFPDGTRLTLAPGDAAGQVRLVDGVVRDGAARLGVSGRLPSGTPALLCAPPVRPGGHPRRVLLRLNVAPAPRLTWLNPGADRTLRVGETVTLRYRLGTDTPPGGLTLRLPAGLTGSLLRLPGEREVGVHLENAGLTAGRTVQPVLTLADGRRLALPGITGSPAVGAVPLGAGEARFRPDPRLLAGLGGLLLLGLLGVALRAWRRRRPRPVRRVVQPAPVPTVEGIRYSEDRTLALVGQDGRVTAVPMPLGGPFDLGQVGRVPHLSGLRLEQDREGLRVRRLPPDLEVSQGARLVREEDVVRPGTLLGVAVARPARSPHPPLGTLVGLGLPLRLRAEGVTLHVTGPYGDHALTLSPGVTDLGEAFRARALHGLKVAPSGPHVLLAALPEEITVRRAADGAELRPGTYLPPEAHLGLPGAD
ncbi:von Willebrand factor type A domain-containing [Deinococcus aerius]|uniref:von Willebrand factor type A domain-containing n=1 Tax=Deinococcus aerius TaxID=200253 RepID=A0A2I9CRM3_9DEIO|nr:VWA domain-containing protein [Deinococcus aerius]GBF04179.1 von Willebrand factor type A domain-containing [Deinococcus aerius]